MSIIARTLDNERLSYEGSVYIRIPEGVKAEDAVVIQKKRLPHLRGVGDSHLAELSREARLVLDTIKAHHTMTASCDRDGAEFCDCLDHATVRLERLLGPEAESVNMAGAAAGGCIQMSDTITDMPKVAQMLDAGWQVKLRRDRESGYVAIATHHNTDLWSLAQDKVLCQMIEANRDGGMNPFQCQKINEADFDTPGLIWTDDFTPEQTLTRLAYKVQGELI